MIEEVQACAVPEGSEFYHGYYRLCSLYYLCMIPYGEFLWTWACTILATFCIEDGEKYVLSIICLVRQKGLEVLGLL